MWDPDDIRQFRERLMSPLCSSCSAPCCHFDDNIALNLTPVEAERLWALHKEMFGTDLALSRSPEAHGMYPNNLGVFSLHTENCPFLENGACRIYLDRPVECSIYPVFDVREVFADWEPVVQVVVTGKCPHLDGLDERVARWMKRKFRGRIVLHRKEADLFKGKFTAYIVPATSTGTLRRLRV